MRFIDSIRISVQTLKANKFRSLLTVMGIVIGISSVIIIVSIGKSGRAAISKQLEQLGSNGINIKLKSGDIEYRDLLTEDDVEYILNNVSEVKSITPVFNEFGTVKTSYRDRDVYILGVNKDFKDVFNIKLLWGRLINDTDTLSLQNVVVIDNILARRLFHRENAVGRKLKLIINKKTVMLTIIGIINSENAMLDDLFGDQIPAFVYMPYTTIQRLSDSKSIDQISIKTLDNHNLDNIGIRIVGLLERKHRNQNKYYAENMLKEKEKMNNIIHIITFIIVSIAAISLVVGGIGIMNIMLVSVSERTREIGIRKAVGAKKKDILGQFLIEAVILTSAGGFIGVLSGLSISMAVSYITGFSFHISVPAICIAILFSAAIGIVFGVYPAKKAADLQPMDALRQE